MEAEPEPKPKEEQVVTGSLTILTLIRVSAKPGGLFFGGNANCRDNGYNGSGGGGYYGGGSGTDYGDGAGGAAQALFLMAEPQSLHPVIYRAIFPILIMQIMQVMGCKSRSPAMPAGSDSWS
jgi:hypothetical protein